MSTIIFLVGHGIPYFETYLLFTYVQEDNDDAITISIFVFYLRKTKNKGQSASVVITLLMTSTHSRSLFRQHFGVEVNIKIATSPCEGGWWVVGVPGSRFISRCPLPAVTSPDPAPARYYADTL